MGWCECEAVTAVAGNACLCTPSLLLPHLPVLGDAMGGTWCVPQSWVGQVGGGRAVGPDGPCGLTAQCCGPCPA